LLILRLIDLKTAALFAAKAEINSATTF